MANIGDKLMDEMELLCALHKATARQGPGGDDQTRQAVQLAGLEFGQHLKIADIGCGTGASTLVLAQMLDAAITAVDLLPDFLDALQDNAQRLNRTNPGVVDKITPLHGSMDALPFRAAEFDVIWSEGAIYNMGFEKGVTYWAQFLRPGGVLAVSEITWLTGARPSALNAYWQKEYPEIDTAATKIAVLERHGFSPLGYFALPRHCWSAHYYRPLQNRFSAFLDQYNHCAQARAIVAAQRQEIALFEQYHAYYGYGFYVARKMAGE